jgi:hypothetical protein
MRIENVRSELPQSLPQRAKTSGDIARPAAVQVELRIDREAGLLGLHGQGGTALAEQQNVMPPIAQTAGRFEHVPCQSVSKADVGGEKNTQVKTSLRTDQMDVDGG